MRDPLVVPLGKPLGKRESIILLQSFPTDSAPEEQDHGLVVRQYYFMNLRHLTSEQVANHFRVPDMGDGGSESSIQPHL